MRTAFDIQTPIPKRVQDLREGRSFLLPGCRFNDLLQRSFARQIVKRTSPSHRAVLPCEPTRNELCFVEKHHVECIDLQLESFEGLLMG